MDILEQCRRWNESGAFEKSREILETIPAEERGPEGDSELATAYLALRRPREQSSIIRRSESWQQTKRRYRKTFGGTG